MPKKSSQNTIKYEIAGVSLILASIYIYISLFSNNSGIVGDRVRILLLGIFGLGAYIVPILIIIVGLAMVYRKDEIQINIKFYSFCTFILAVLITLFLVNYNEIEGADAKWIDSIRYYYTLGTLNAGGGAVGSFFGYAFIRLFGMIGTISIVTALYLISILMFTEISALSILEFIKQIFVDACSFIKNKGREAAVTRELQRQSASDNQKVTGFVEDIDDTGKANVDRKVKILDFTKRFDKDFRDKSEGEARENAGETTGMKEPGYNNGVKADEATKITPISNKHYTNYKMPGISLLSLPTENKSGNGKKEVMNNVKILEDTLRNFGVSASISQVSVGPAITRYELQLSPGVKVSKILSLADDISLSLASPGIRIEAPIPGKAAIGIEVPNKDITMVLLREVLESEEFRKQKSKISFCLGKDVAGANVVADLAKMPHLLIAGSTGSGKSVCVNALIASILYKATPDEVKLLLIDPKVVELSIYNKIPHLLVPVVTDPKKAAGALNWAVMEMTERYKKFASNNVRDIYGYNKSGKEELERLPQIVVVIDELADLMMVSPGEVEDSICRLAQMARAAGIHLVVATQRPSVDVITGLIKANIPSRISFAVSSHVDSRTIIDMGGAEKLLGKGDALFYPVGEAKPIRVQGAFVSEKEIERLVNFIKGQVSVDYDNQIIKEIEQKARFDEDSEADELLNDAIRIVVESGQASILMLQRRLKIGYSRAARIIDQMEERNIIGRFEGSKPRKVLVSREDIDAP